MRLSEQLHALKRHTHQKRSLQIEALDTIFSMTERDIISTLPAQMQTG